jgi:capsular polysaccharide biosynthesis protein
MEIKTYFDIISRRKWVIIPTAVILIVVVFIAARFMPPQFTSTAQLRVITPTGGSSSYVDFNIWYADRLMNTYAELAKSATVRDELKQKLNLSQDPKVTISVVPSSEIINIRKSGRLRQSLLATKIDVSSERVGSGQD